MTAPSPTTSSRETMRHASIYSSAAVLSRLVSFIMLPFYAHLLRGEGYAVIGMIDVGISLLVSLLGYSMSGAIVLLYHEEPNPDRKPRIVSTGVIVSTAASAALVVLPIVFAGPLSALLLNDASLAHLLIMGLVGFVFSVTGQAASSWLLIRSRSVLFATINVVSLIAGLSLNILFVVLLDLGLNGYFIANLISIVFTNAIYVFFTARDCGWRFDRDVAVSVRRFIVPLIPGNLVSFISRQIERVLVKFQVGLSAVGILEMGYKFPILIAQLITTPFMQSWGTRRFEIAGQPEAPAQLGRMFTYYLFLVAYAGLVMAATIRPVLVVLTPPEFHLAYRIAQLEILTLILQGCEWHLMFGLFWAKHTAVITKVRTATALAKIGLAYFFVSTWSIYGAAFSAAIMAAVSLFWTYSLAQRRYRIILEWRKIFVLSGVATAAFAFIHFYDISRLPGFSFISIDLTSAVAAAIAKTSLGRWHDQVLTRMFRDHGRQIAEIAVNGLLASSYGLLLPWVRNATSLSVSGDVINLAPKWVLRIMRLR